MKEEKRENRQDKIPKHVKKRAHKAHMKWCNWCFFFYFLKCRLLSGLLKGTDILTSIWKSDIIYLPILYVSIGHTFEKTCLLVIVHQSLSSYSHVFNGIVNMTNNWNRRFGLQIYNKLILWKLLKKGKFTKPALNSTSLYKKVHRMRCNRDSTFTKPWNELLKSRRFSPSMYLIFLLECCWPFS